MASQCQEQRIEKARKNFNDHWDRQNALHHNLSVAMNNLTHNSEIWPSYSTFFDNAHAVSTSLVRVYDILSWWKEVDAETSAAVSALQDYYHKEARLFYRLKQVSGVVPDTVQRDLAELCGEDGDAAEMTFDGAIGMDMWRWEDTYAIAFDENSPRFGYETEMPGLGAVHLRFANGGPDQFLLVPEIVANYAVRIVRLQQADREERFGASRWAESVDSRVLDWIEEAMELVPERYGKLRASMQKWIRRLKKRKSELWTLMTLRAQEKVLMNDVRDGEPNKRLSADIEDTRRNIDEEVKRLVGIYGEREKWDWVD